MNYTVIEQISFTCFVIKILLFSTASNKHIFCTNTVLFSPRTSIASYAHPILAPALGSISGKHSSNNHIPRAACMSYDNIPRETWQCVSFLQRAHATSTDQSKGATEVQLSEPMGFLWGYLEEHQWEGLLTGTQWLRQLHHHKPFQQHGWWLITAGNQRLIAQPAGSSVGGRVSLLGHSAQLLLPLSSSCACLRASVDSLLLL